MPAKLVELIRKVLNAMPPPDRKEFMDAILEGFCWNCGAEDEGRLCPECFKDFLGEQS